PCRATDGILRRRCWKGAEPTRRGCQCLCDGTLTNSRRIHGLANATVVRRRRWDRVSAACRLARPARPVALAPAHCKAPDGRAIARILCAGFVSAVIFG